MKFIFTEKVLLLLKDAQSQCPAQFHDKKWRERAVILSLPWIFIYSENGKEKIQVQYLNHGQSWSILSSRLDLQFDTSYLRLHVREGEKNVKWQAIYFVQICNLNRDALK